MRRLVALDLDAGPRFVDELRRTWDAGDAAFPVDGRLPDAAKADLIDRMGAEAVVTAAGSATLAPGRPVDDGDALVVATSGTSGDPKGVVLTHDAVQASATITSRALEVDPGTDAWLCCLPVAHIGGLSVITRALHTGTPLATLPRFDPEECEAAARAGATLVSLVVAALPRLDASLFRTILLGGSAIPSDRPDNTVATYGMTETGSGIVYEGWPLDGVALRIVDDEIQVRSPTLLRGYRDGTAPLTPDGWLATGDAGSLADDGRLSVVGRIGDVIVTGGEKVWPIVVERAMRTLPWVAEVAVTGTPDQEWGALVTAFVVPVAGVTASGLEETRDALRAQLPGYSLPRRLRLVDELPRTALGKVRRGAL